MKSCKTCKYAIFCPTWGDYKCTERKRRMKDPDADGEACGLYVQGEPSQECHCDDCEEYKDA